MNDLAQDVMMGGWAMYPILLLGCLGTFGGVTGFVLALAIGKNHTLWMAAALMALGLLAPLLGGLGYAMGMSSMQNALVNVNPDDVEVIRQVGTGEALTCIQFGLGAGLLPFCLGLALVGIGLVRARTGAQAQVRG